MLRFLIIALAATAAVAEVDRFDGYKVFAVIPTTEAHLTSLRRFEEANLGFDLWSRPARLDTAVHIMVPPHMRQEFDQYMKGIGVNYTTYIEDVQHLIDNENGPNPLARSEPDFKSYQTLDQIYSWLDSLHAAYPDRVEVLVGGTTYEGREIRGVKISFKRNNPGVFIEGGIHAREWIATATVGYLINQILTSRNPDIRKLAESNDWYIFPVFNPDGYVYTHTHNRMWRKTRSRTNLFCYGADPNRNWPYQWMNGGASSSACSESFAGSAPWSEIETKSMAKYIDSISDKFYAYISFHSFSQLLLFPYGHTTEHLENYDELLEIGTKAANALKQRYGTTYTVGNIAETIYVATGSTVDWVKATYKTPITFIYELRDLGRFGFLLPADQIIPTGEETMDSLVAMFEAARARGHGV